VSQSTIQVSFGRPYTTVASATQVTLADTSPIEGMVTDITLHFPDGCNALVEIRCLINQVQVLPVTGFIALNNTTKDFSVNRTIRKNDKLRVVIANRDAANAHTPSIIWNLEGVP
jgi:hypothetical protein